MEFLACDGTITVDPGTGAVGCTGSWSGVATMTHELVLRELDGPDIAALIGAALVVFAIAYGVRVARQVLWR